MLLYKPIIHKIIYKNFELSVLRLDLIHSEISGNKWFKLKYNLQQAALENKDTIMTFGGAYSNHIAATAVACRINNFNCIGVIRGDDTIELNDTLTQAQKNGMQLKFISRELYKQKDTAEYLNELQKKYPNAYIIPEGGSNVLGEKGCQEIITNDMNNYSTIFCAYGTGNTFRGIKQSISNQQKLIGINVLKYHAKSDSEQSPILNDYHFGGYAKHTNELLVFKNQFEKNYEIPLDYVYTTKLFFAVFDLMDRNKIKSDETILVVHSGGLQGNVGYEKRYQLT